MEVAIAGDAWDNSQVVQVACPQESERTPWTVAGQGFRIQASVQQASVPHADSSGVREWLGRHVGQI